MKINKLYLVIMLLIGYMVGSLILRQKNNTDKNLPGENLATGAFHQQETDTILLEFIADMNLGKTTFLYFNNNCCNTCIYEVIDYHHIMKKSYPQVRELLFFSDYELSSTAYAGLDYRMLTVDEITYLGVENITEPILINIDSSGQEVKRIHVDLNNIREVRAFMEEHLI